MSYGVILCDRCGHAKGIRLGTKRTRCLFCNRTLNCVKLRVRFESDALKEITKVIQNINTRRERGVEEYQTVIEEFGWGGPAPPPASPPAPPPASPLASPRAPADPAPQPSSPASSSPGGMKGRILALLETLAAASATDTVEYDRFVAAVEETTIPLAKAEALLDALAAAGRVYEPQPGRYRLIH